MECSEAHKGSAAIAGSNQPGIPIQTERIVPQNDHRNGGCGTAGRLMAFIHFGEPYDLGFKQRLERPDVVELRFHE
jgi:hypothetical protein